VKEKKIFKLCLILTFKQRENRLVGVE